MTSHNEGERQKEGERGVWHFVTPEHKPKGKRPYGWWGVCVCKGSEKCPKWP